MRIQISAIGRMTRGPEAELLSFYQTRFDQLAKPNGFSQLALREMEAKKSNSEDEAKLLRSSVPTGDMILALDERGRQMSSPEFARQLATWRDQGRSGLCFMIGGADGLARDLREAAEFKLSFGAMVWPHMLARVMLAEQLYRAASILSNKPYHRE